MTQKHNDLQDSGLITHTTIDSNLPTALEKAKLQIISEKSPGNVTGARNTPEAALANLLVALETLGLITDSTTAS